MSNWNLCLKYHDCVQSLSLKVVCQQKEVEWKQWKSDLLASLEKKAGFFSLCNFVASFLPKLIFIQARSRPWR